MSKWGIQSMFYIILSIATTTTKSFVRERREGCPKFDVVLSPNCEVSCDCAYYYDRVMRCDGECSEVDVVPDILRRLTSNSSLLDLSIRELPVLSTEGEFGKMHTPPSSLVVSTNGALADVKPDAFVGLEESLETLSLIGNALQSLPKGLSSLELLQTLDVSKNHISTLIFNEENGAPGLRSLNAGSNRLQTVIFQIPMIKLEKIILKNNSIDSGGLSELMESVGIHCPSAELINMGVNSVKGILSPSHFPTEIRSLSYLDASNNEITGITPGTFVNVPNLKSLSLKGNKITTIVDGSFRGLGGLSFLDLSINVLNSFQREDSEFPSLNKLDLSDNRLHVLNANYAVSALKVIELDNNLITSVETDSLESLRDINVLNIKNNPLNCDCDLHYFQSWLSEHENLNRKSRNSAICKTPHGFSGEELLSIIKLSSTCGNSNFDYLDDEDDRNNSSLLRKNEDNDVRISEGEEGLLRVFFHSLIFKCDRISVFDKEDEDAEIYSKPISEKECSSTDNSSSILLSPESARLNLGHSYVVCISGRRRRDYGVIRRCSEAYALKGEPRPPAVLNSFDAKVIGEGVLEMSYNISSVSEECGLWVLIKREAQTLATRLLSCNSTEEVFGDLPDYPEYGVCYSLREGVFESGDKTDACVRALSSTTLSEVVLVDRGSTAVLPLVLTLIFLAIGCAALVVLYLIVRGYLSDRRNASLFHRSGLKPPLSEIFECFKRNTRRTASSRTRNSSSSSALYLNGVEEETIEDFDF